MWQPSCSPLGVRRFEARWLWARWETNQLFGERNRNLPQHDVYCSHFTLKWRILWLYRLKGSFSLVIIFSQIQEQKRESREVEKHAKFTIKLKATETELCIYLWKERNTLLRSRQFLACYSVGSAFPFPRLLPNLSFAVKIFSVANKRDAMYRTTMVKAVT